MQSLRGEWLRKLAAEKAGGPNAYAALAELAASPQQARFGLAKRDTLPQYCLECPVRFICNGGCPKERLARAPDGQPGLNILCAGYKAFFTHIDGPMRVMAGLLRQGRAPAEIMSMLLPSTPARPRHRKR